MRYLCSVAVFVALGLAPSALFGQSAPSELSIVNYQLVSEMRLTRSQWFATYSAKLLNTGAPLAGVTATVASVAPGVQVTPGQGILHFKPVPTNSQVTSSDTFTILVDRDVVFDFSSLKWSFSNPVADPGPNQTAAVGRTVTLNGGGSRNPAAAGTLGYIWSFVSRPAGSSATLTGDHGVISSFVVDLPGDYVLSLAVSNGTARDSANVTVSTINSPPVAKAGANQTVADGSSVTLNGGGSSDIDGDPLTYLWTLVSRPAGSSAFIAAFASVTPSFVADKPGAYVAQLVVNDGKGDSVPSTVVINTGNTPPVAIAGGAQIAGAGTLVSLNGSGSTDVDGDGLHYSWSLIAVPSGSRAQLGSAAAVHTTFTADLPGTYIAQLIVNDGKIDSAPSTVTIATNAVLAPTADAGQNQTGAPSATITLAGAGSDPQGLPLTSSWSLIHKPAGSVAVLSDNSVLNPKFVADKPGTYIAQLIVNNGSLNSAPATVTISTLNTPPVANAGASQSVASGSTVTLDGGASSDADRDSLSYSWSLVSRPTGSTATLLAPATKQPAFVADQAGTYVAQLIVNDGVRNSAPSTVTIDATAAPVNSAKTTLASIVSGGSALIAATVPTPVSVNPASGNGLSQTFEFTFSNPTGAENLGVLNILINRFLDGRQGCYIAYVPASPTSGTLLLVNDAGDAGGPFQFLSLPSADTVSNSQCTITGTGSSVLGSGNILTLTLAMTFNSNFAGTKIINVAARDNAGNNSGWRPIGVWKVPGPPVTGPSVVSVSPARSNTAAQTYTFTYSHTNGFGDLAVLNVLVNRFLDGRNGCYIAYVPSGPTSGTVLLVNDNGDAGGPFQFLSIPSAGMVQNSQCTISGAGASVLGSGNNLALTLPITFSQSFEGDQVIYAAARSNTAGSDWQSVGTVTVKGAPASITALSGSLQSAGINAPFPSPLSVIVRDSANNPVSGAAVTFTAPSSGASGSFAGGVTTATTDVSGVAISAAFTANGVLGSYTVTASIGALSTGFSLTNQPGVAASIAVVSGTLQSTAVNAPFANPLTVLVKDPGNNPVSGALVTFTAPGTGASGSFLAGQNTAVTNASGMATSTVFTANSVGGQYIVTASAGAPSTSFLLTNQQPASITVTGGSPQIAVVNTAFANRLRVIVRDASNNPVNGAVVTFAVPVNGASGAFAGGIATATTDSTGTATSENFIANSVAGSYSVTASLGPLSTGFALTNQPGPPASIAVASGSPQNTTINTAFANPLTVIVKDAANNPISGVTVTFAAPPGGAGGLFAGAQNTAVTDAAGVATSVSFTANSTAGSYSVTATLGALSTSFSLTNQPGAPASIAVTGGSPQSAPINTAFAGTLRAIVKDASNNPINGVAVTFAAPASGASGTFAAGVTTVVTDATGTATSAVFTSNASVGAYSVTATVDALTTSFALTNLVGPPASLTMTGGSPQSTEISAAFANVLSVIVKDAGDNPISGASVTFAAPGTGASGTFASGQNIAVTDSTGTATSVVFTANSTAGSYSVTASLGALSTNFALTNRTGPPASIAVTGGSPQNTAIDTAFANALKAIVKDAGDNPVVGVTVTFAAPGTGASGAFAGGQNTAVTDATGTATSVSFTANNIVGAYTVTATVNALTTSFALTNHAGPPASVAMTSGSPQSTQINTAFANALTVVVKDAGNNPVSGATVTFAAPGSGASGAFAGGQNTAITDATGTATSAVFTANSTAGSYSVTASVGALSATFALTNQTGPAASIGVTSGSPQSAAIDTAFANALTVIVKDAGNNPISGATVTFAAPGSGASGAFAGGQNTAVTDAAGIATSEQFTANSTVGAYAVTATVGALSTNFALTNHAGPPASMAATGGTPQSAAINTPFATALTVLVKDAGNNPVSGATVTFDAPGSGASGVFAAGQNTSVTDASGVATAVIFTANSTAGTYTVTATLGALSTNFELTNQPGPATSIVVTSGSPQSTVVNTAFPSTLSVIVKDAGNNPISGATVTFAAPSSGSSGTFAGGQNTAVTDSTGTATSVVFTADSVAGSYSVTASIGALSANFALTNQAGPAASIVTTNGSPQSAAINTAFASALSVVVKDASNNPVSGATVNFAAPESGAGGAFAGGQNTAVTDSTGTATSAVFAANSIVGAYTVTASLGALSTNFALTNHAGPPASIAATAGSPQTAEINASFASALTVQVKDAGNNPVSGVTVTFAAPGSGASGAFAGGQNTAITDSTGTATSAVFTANSIAGNYAVTASVGALSASFALTNQAGPAASIVVTSGSPQNAAINTSFATALTILVKDAGNNPVSGATVTFAVPGNGASGSFAGGQNTAVTDAAGSATSAQFTANNIVGNYAVTATVGALSAEFALSNHAGPPASITVTGGSPQSTVINSAFASVLTVHVQDAGNNPVIGETVTFAAPGSGASGSFAGGQNTAVTDANGTATSVVFTANSTAGSYAVTASIGALSANFALTNQAGPATSVAVASGSPQIAPINTAFANLLTVLVKDAGNNPVSGVTVTFAAPGSGASGEFAGGQNTAVTDANGIATSAQLTANSIVGSYNVNAGAGALSTSFALTNQAGPAVSMVATSGTPQNAAINTVFANALTVIVKDAGNNPVSGATVTFAAPGSGASGSFAGNVTTATTDANGIAAAVAFTGNSTAGSYTVTASLGALSTSFALTNQPGPAASIAVTAGSPQSTVIDTAFANTLSVLVKDSGNNPVSGATVTFAAPGSGAGGAFAGVQNTAVTDANGAATSAVFTANSVAGTYSVTASIGALSTGFSLTNQAGPAASIAVAGGSPQSTPVNTAFASALSVLVTDSGNNPVPGATVTFAAPGSGATGSFAGAQNTAITDANGIATSVQFTANNTVGGYNVTATLGALSTNFAMTNQPGVPASIAVAGGSPQSAVINSQFATPLSVLVKDTGNNPLSGVTVTFAAPGSGASGSFAGAQNTAVTDANGIATSAAFTANATAGGYAVTATVGALSTNFALTNQAGAAASIAVAGGSPQSIPVNTVFASALSVLVKDSGNNPVPGATVTFAAPGSGASGSFAGAQNTAVTDANGIATSVQFTANNTVGGYNVTATVGALSTNFALTNQPGAPASISVAGGSPQSSVINSQFATSLAALVKDAGDHPLSGVTVTFAAPGSGATGAFAGGQNTAVTDANGIATSAAFTANSTAGSYAATATVGALSTSFALTNQAGAAASITVTGGSPQSAVIDTAFANVLTVLVKDAGNNPVIGATVTFAAPVGGASGAFAGGLNTAVTDANGIAASVAFTANSTVGSYSVTASIGALSTSFALTNQAGAPASIAVNGGSPQSAVINSQFGSLLSALVKDAGNNPLSGVTVTFAAPGSGASGAFAEGQTTAVTGATGIATSAAFTANATAGSYAVTATAGALSTNFSLTNQVGPAASMTVSGGSPQSAPINTAFANPLSVLVKDAGNNPISGATVTFTVPGSGPSGAFAGANTAVTDAAGTATSAQFIANGTLGGYNVTATVGALSTNFALTNQAAPPASLTIVSGSGQNAVVNTVFTNPLRVLVKNAANNPVSGVTVTFTPPASDAGGAFAGGQNTAITDANGIATSAQFTANGTIGIYNVSASVVGVTPVNFTLNNTIGGGGVINVSNLIVGKDLQATLPITINPAAPQGGVMVTVQSSDGNLVLVGSSAVAGQSSTSISIAEGVSTVSTVVQALGGSGTVTLTLSAPGYANANATITLAPSGFVLSGPNGVGQQFSTYQGVTTPLTVSAGRLDSSGMFAANQQVRGGFSVDVPLASTVSSVGTVSSSNLLFNSGSATMSFDFVASSVNSGVTDILVSTPSGFTTPSVGASANVVVQQSGLVPFSATIGQGLQKLANVSVTGVVGSNLAVTLTSNDPAKLKFATTATGPSQTAIVVTIPSGHTMTPDFYVRALNSAGSVGYSISASGYNTANGTVTLAASGLAIESPGGLGAPTFQAQVEFGSANIIVHTGRLNSSGVFVESQAVVGDGSLSVTVVSSNPAIGTIASSPIVVAGGSSTATAIFQPVAVGNTTITASAAQFASAQVVATITGGSLILPPTLVIGKNLQEEVHVILPFVAGAGGVQVTVQSNSPSLEIAATGNGAGSSSVVITVPAGANYTTFYIHGMGASGTVTYTATAPGVNPATGSVQLTPSAIVLYPPFSSRPIAQGSATLSVALAALDDENYPYLFQSLAGGQPLVVTVGNSNPSVASTMPTVTILPGSNIAFLTVAFLNTGSTSISITQPSGFSTPATLGSAVVSITP